MLKGSRKQVTVSLAELLEAILKPSLEPSEDRLWSGRFVLVAAHDVEDHSGHKRSREKIRRQHGEHHGLGQRHKQELGHSCEEEHGNKDDANTDRRYKGRQRNL